MNLWRRTRTEVAGAWRSVRYDIGRRPPEPAPGPEVTSTAMNTFAGAVDQATGAPRRLVTVSAFGVLAVAGATGTYVAVAGGLGTLLTEKSAAAQPYPLATTAPPRAGTSNAGLGQGPATVGRPDAPATVLSTTPPTLRAPAAVPGRALPPAARVTPEQVKPPARRPCACPAPPVPTPTQPSTSPSATPSPSASPSESASPSASASPSTSGSAEVLMRRSHIRGY